MIDNRHIGPWERFLERISHLGVIDPRAHAHLELGFRALIHNAGRSPADAALESATEESLQNVKQSLLDDIMAQISQPKHPALAEGMRECLAAIMACYLDPQTPPVLRLKIALLRVGSLTVCAEFMHDCHLAGVPRERGAELADLIPGESR
ncbi:MAG: hypothetical protein KIT44_02775 [Opitutaceae bacterium]|nr:hypothetical protein [Opitutaceae bacterium]